MPLAGGVLAGHGGSPWPPAGLPQGWLRGGSIASGALLNGCLARGWAARGWAARGWLPRGGLSGGLIGGSIARDGLRFGRPRGAQPPRDWLGRGWVTCGSPRGGGFARPRCRRYGVSPRSGSLPCDDGWSSGIGGLTLISHGGPPAGLAWPAPREDGRWDIAGIGVTSAKAGATTHYVQLDHPSERIDKKVRDSRPVSGGRRCARWPAL